MGNISQTVSEYLKTIVPNMNLAVTIGIIFSIVMAALYCFFGYKFLKFQISFLMFLIGAMIGAVIGMMAGLDVQVVLAIALVLAIILAVLGFFLYKAGVFLLVAIATGGALYAYLSDINHAQYVIFICIAVGIAFGALACFFVRPVVIIMTALSGGISISNGLIDNFLVQVGQLNTPRTTEYIVLVVGAIFAVFGMIFQFRSTENYEDRRQRRKDD